MADGSYKDLGPGGNGGGGFKTRTGNRPTAKVGQMSSAKREDYNNRIKK